MHSGREHSRNSAASSPPRISTASRARAASPWAAVPVRVAPSGPSRTSPGDPMPAGSPRRRPPQAAAAARSGPPPGSRSPHAAPLRGRGRPRSPRGPDRASGLQEPVVEQFGGGELLERLAVASRTQRADEVQRKRPAGESVIHVTILTGDTWMCNIPPPRATSTRSAPSLPCRDMQCTLLSMAQCCPCQISEHARFFY